MKERVMSEGIREFSQWIKSIGLEHTLPRNLSQLESITSLDLSRKKLTHLPESIGALQNLSILKISGNRLKALPKSLSTLKNLRNFQCENNLLEHLPEDF